MREIKFRAWDKEEKEMVFSEEENCCYWDTVSFDNPPVMQYIGLKDKNKLDIYESDKIKYRENYYEVRWVGAGFWLVNPNLTDIELHSNSSKEMEIIGNIWEDQEVQKTNIIKE